MLQYEHHIDKITGYEWIATALKGKALLQSALLNKDTAFSLEERDKLELVGLLPARVETLDEQVARIRYQYQRYPSDLQKFIFLHSLHHRNETLFYKFVSGHLAECFPVLYTPGVGEAVRFFSEEYRQPRGLYLNFAEKDKMEKMFDNRFYPEVDLIVVTDGEGVLGIGDQGIGGMNISIAKLMVYSLCGINPYRTLPIILDVGTDNKTLLNDPLYVGWRANRVRGQQYDDFIKQFVDLVHQKFPNSFLHWEDFGRDNARRILDQHKSKHCMFNDDMQGTGVVTLAALLAAVNATKIPFQNQRVVIFGAGTAGVGIADQLCAAMIRYGLSQEEARKRFWLIDKYGLLLEDSPSLTTFQKPYARTKDEVAKWPDLDLMNVVRGIKPTILVGCSTVRGAFTPDIIIEMNKHVARPIIFPLSNPTEKCEARPENIFQWTHGSALIATGSPFGDVDYNRKSYRIAQCNNALAFPGIGLGVLAVGASELTDNMLWAASLALSKLAPVRSNPEGALLPALSDILGVSRLVACDVANMAIQEKVATKQLGRQIEDVIDDLIWKAEYKEIRSL
ncbi:MAG: NAD-dependent malic enzyme [Gammaproteobacteria bacterium]